jgi:hypothetical protein
MDADLAFCLGQFIDDQVQIIDDSLEKIKQEEIVEYRKIEKEQIAYNKKKPAPKKKGSYHEDKNLVDQFIQELRNSIQPSNTKSIVDDKNCIDTLRADVSTKVNASTKYIRRLRNLAQRIPNSSKFVQTCNETMERFRQAQKREDNFKKLCTVLEESDKDNVLSNVQKWWKDTYGSTITDINRRNQRFSAAVTENSFVSVSKRSRIAENSSRLLDARKIIFVQPSKLDIIRKFVAQLLSIDEEKRDTINADELIDQLNTRNIDDIIDYAKQWLAKRDEIRNKKEEKDPCM